MSLSTHPALEEARALFASGNAAGARERLYSGLPDPRCLSRLREHLLAERRNDEAAQLLRDASLDDTPDAWVNRAVHKHLEGDFEAAVLLCRHALAAEAAHAPAYNHLGRALHNMGRADEALNAFRAATAAMPSYAEAWHSLGHALRARGDFAGARSAFEQALGHCPGLDRARLDLGIVHQAMDEVDLALTQYRQLLDADPDHIDALLNSGLALQLVNDSAGARSCYRRVLELEPANQTALYYYGTLLNAELDTEAALDVLGRALAMDPRDPDVWFELAGAYEQSNRLEESAEAARKGLEAAPGHPGLLIQSATAARREGRLDEALAILDRLDPRRLPPRTALSYAYERGTVLDRLDRADAAMEAFSMGNHLAAQSLRQRHVDPEAFHRRIARMEQWLAAGAALPPRAPGSGQEGEGLCFLIGFPRSGTTLLDTMLDAHPQVNSIEEKQTLELVIDHLNDLPGGYPAVLPTLDEGRLRTLRILYLERISTLGAPLEPGRIVVDKLPLRLINAPLIQALFPAARLIFCKRHPCDVILSNFMQNYAVNEAFSNFLEFGGCVRTYAAVMSLWQKLDPVLDLRVHRIAYEDLVVDPQRSLSAVCGFLGIESTDAMMDPETRLAGRGRIGTNSYHQVAEDIYQRSSGRWQRYRSYFSPYLATLEPVVERHGYTLD